MKQRTFKHGIHPARDGKAYTKDAPIQEYRATGQAVYPLSQHIGAPAKAIVAVGDEVKVGQMIAEADGFVSVPICGAVSGKVKAIEPRLTINGRKVPCIVIENDGAFTPIDTLGQERDPRGMTKEAILAAIRDAGIVGQGGAGFPTHVKLTMKEGVSPDTVIINAAECEPYLTSDYRLMLEQPDKLLAGLQVVLQLFNTARGVIAIENNKPEAIRLLTEKTAAYDRIEVCSLKTKYPQGGERMLIHAVTGRDIHSKKLPIDAGCVVLNVSTVVSIDNAVRYQIPQISTVMTLTGDGMNTPCNVAVPTGTSHAELVEAFGGLKEGVKKIVSGGPMMGQAMTDLNVPVVKTSSSVLAMLNDEVAEWEPSPCIRCGRCVRACPSFLVPAMMGKVADAGDLAAYEALNGMECIECGCCTYVCPAKRRLTQSFKFAKTAINDARKRAKASADAKQ